jgi:hypothetical protein
MEHSHTNVTLPKEAPDHSLPHLKEHAGSHETNKTIELKKLPLPKNKPAKDSQVHGYTKPHHHGYDLRSHAPNSKQPSG